MAHPPSLLGMRPQFQRLHAQLVCGFFEVCSIRNCCPFVRNSFVSLQRERAFVSTMTALALRAAAQGTNQGLKPGFRRQRAQARIALQRRHIGKALGSGSFQGAERCLDVALL